MTGWIATLGASATPIIDPASSPAAIAAAETAIGRPATAWAVAAADRIASRVAEESRDTPTPLVMGDLERQGCESCLLTVLSAIAQGTAARDLHVPEEAIHQVRTSVRRGTTLDTILRTVWAAHTHVQDELFTVLEQEVPLTELATEMRSLTSQLFAYVDVIVQDLTENYEDERILWQGRVSAARRRMVDDIVSGGDVPDDAEVVLGIDLQHHHHLAAVFRTVTLRYEEKRDAEISHLAYDFARKLGATALLALERPEGVTELVWSFRSPPPDDYRARIRAATLPDWLTVGLGVPSRGVDGFRFSYQCAYRAVEVGALSAPSGVGLSAYEDVQMAALLIADPVHAEAYARRLLKGLTGPSSKIVDLRATLRHYLLGGRSRRAAAEALHLAPTTVAYRVKRAEELLGRPAGELVVETLVALELAHHFPQFVE